MTPDRAARAVKMLETLRTDIAADVASLEGAPFSAHLVSVAFGNLGAQVDALANVLIAMLETDGTP